MPLPTASDVHVNAPLTNLSIAYAQNESKFIATKASPIVPSSKQGDLYFEYDRADFLRDEAKLRAPATESVGAGWRMSTNPFFCNVFALHKDVDDQIRANQDSAINMDRDAALYVAQKLLLKREKDFFAAAFATGTWTGSTSGADITPAWAGPPVACGGP